MFFAALVSTSLALTEPHALAEPPAPSQPAPAQPASVQPTPTQPAPAQPAPAQPAPAQPAPAQPAPAQPAPTQPAPPQAETGDALAAPNPTAPQPPAPPPAVPVPPPPSATPVTPPPTVGPEPAAPPAAEGPDPERLFKLDQLEMHRRMMLAGWSVLGASYLASVVVGVYAIDNQSYLTSYDPDLSPEEQAREDEESRQKLQRYGGLMLIPVAGPFIAVSQSQSATGGMLTVLMGLVQTTGLVLGSIGTKRFVDGRRNLSISASWLPEGGGLSLRGRF